MFALARTDNQAQRECDTLAANPLDSYRPAGIPGVPFKQVDAGRAAAACQRAVQEEPSPRTYYELGRALAAAHKDVAAVANYRIAADQGYATAQNNLGVMYEDGRGIARDFAQAALWYRKAADQGYAPAQDNLGLMYEHGRGVARDQDQATLLYRKAAQQGYEDARTHLSNAEARSTTLATAGSNQSKGVYVLADSRATFQQNLLDLHYCGIASSEELYEKCMRERGHIIYKDGRFLMPPILPENGDAAALCEHMTGGKGEFYTTCMDAAHRGLSREMAKEEAAENLILGRARSMKPPPSSTSISSLPAPPSPRANMTTALARPPASPTPSPAPPTNSAATPPRVVTTSPPPSSPTETAAPLAPQDSFLATAFEEGKSAVLFCGTTKIILAREDLGHCLVGHWATGMIIAYGTKLIKQEVCQHPDKYDTDVVQWFCR
jgi:hypothetical protein